MHDFTEEDLLILERNRFEPHFLGVYQFYNSTPLIDTTYAEYLENEVYRRVAEECDWNAFDYFVNSLKEVIDDIKDCYTSALNDDIYEAANNLGIMEYLYYQNADKAKDYLNVAIEHGSQKAMINLFTILWCENPHLGIEYLTIITERQRTSLRCLFNLAYLYYIGDQESGNTINKDIKKQSKYLNEL